MIIEKVLQVIYSVFTAIIGILPSVPSIPQSLLDGAYFIMEKVNEVNGVVIYLVSPALYVVGIGLILFIMLYDLAVKVVVAIVFNILLRKVIG